jgi:hypothetical protein
MFQALRLGCPRQRDSHDSCGQAYFRTSRLPAGVVITVFDRSASSKEAIQPQLQPTLILDRKAAHWPTCVSHDT